MSAERKASARGNAARAAGASRHTRPLLIVAYVAATLIGLGVSSTYALITFPFDLIAALFVIGPGILGGLCIAGFLLPASMPFRWHLLIGATLGPGLLALLVLLLGLAGLFERGVWLVILTVAAVGGVWQWRRLQTASSRLGADATSGTGKTDASVTVWHGLWLLTIPFLVVAILAASHAPGLLWSEEGFGYDVLEYHLQVPREYFQAGRIAYLPHNVYASFPSNVEMLYLLAMIVLDDAAGVGTVANVIHLLLGALTVAAAWVIGRDWSPRAGIACGVTAGTIGWLPYLSGLAYVEHGMLLFGLAATGLVLRSLDAGAGRRAGVLNQPTDDDSRRRGAEPTLQQQDPRRRAAPTEVRGSLVAGVLAGLACGCKYTAVPMIALPLALVTLVTPPGGVQRRMVRTLVFAGGVLLTFSPWLARNVATTGNPVFPLANAAFEAQPQGWGPESTGAWQAGHRPGEEEASLIGRLNKLWVHVLGDRYQRFGPALFAVALIGLTGRRRTGVDAALLRVLVIQLGVWLLATHLYARFAIVMLIPLTLLCGRAVLDGGAIRGRLVFAALAAGAVFNLVFLGRLYADEGVGGAPASMMTRGQVRGYEHIGFVNETLPDDAKILLVGEARAFYFERDVDYFVTFNRNPFFVLIEAGAGPDELMEWLRRRGYTHVVINWAELRRLARTYGLVPDVSPEAVRETIERLDGAGLEHVRAFTLPETDARYVDVYRVAQRLK